MQAGAKSREQGQEREEQEQREQEQREQEQRAGVGSTSMRSGEHEERDARAQ